MKVEHLGGPKDLEWIEIGDEWKEGHTTKEWSFRVPGGYASYSYHERGDGTGFALYSGFKKHRNALTGE